MKSSAAGHVLAIPDLDAEERGADDATFIRAARWIADRMTAPLELLLPEGCGEAETAALADIQWHYRPIPGAGIEHRHAAAARLLADRAVAFLLVPDTWRGADLGRRIAVAENRDLAAGVIAFEAGQVVTLCGERAFERRRPPPFVWLIDREFDFGEVQVPLVSTASRLDIDAITPLLFDAGVVDAPARNAAVEDAEFVMAAGAGVDDWEAFHALVDAMGATPGASRVVCDRGLMPRHRQVGSSGHLTAARCYVALGISGAIQHLDGIAACETVISVNTDARAPITARADLSIVADADAVMRAALSSLGRAGVRSDA